MDCPASPLLLLLSPTASKPGWWFLNFLCRWQVMWIYYIFGIKLIILLNFLRKEKKKFKKSPTKINKTLKPRLTATRKKPQQQQQTPLQFNIHRFLTSVPGTGSAISSTTRLHIQFSYLHICLLAVLKSPLNPFCHKVSLPSSCIICLQGIFAICETETNFKL